MANTEPHRRPQQTGWLAGMWQLSVHVFSGGAPTTCALLILILFFYTLESLHGGVHELEAMVRLGALRPDRVFEHNEWYRIFCSMFLHFGPIHLLFNSVALLQLGALCEQVYGSLRVGILYIVCGSVAAVASMTLNNPEVGGSVGASGAIMGLAGLLLGLSMFGRGPLQQRIQDLVGPQLRRAVLLTFGLGFAIWLIQPVVDNAAHAGGFVAGLLCAVVVRDPTRPIHALTPATAGSVCALLMFSWIDMAWDGQEAVHTMHIDRADRCEDALALEEDPTTVGALLACAAESWHKAGLPARALALTHNVLHDDMPSEALPVAGMLLFDTVATIETEWILNRWVEAQDSSTARNALAWHLLTRQDIGRRDPARAMALVESVAQDEAYAKNFPFEHALVLDTYANALFTLGRVDDARPIQERAYNTLRTQPLAWTMPGEIWAVRQRLQAMDGDH